MRSTDSGDAPDGRPLTSCGDEHDSPEQGKASGLLDSAREAAVLVERLVGIHDHAGHCAHTDRGVRSSERWDLSRPFTLWCLC